MRRYVFPVSVFFAAVFIVFSLWVGNRQIGAVDRLEKRIHAAREHRHMLDRVDQALLISAESAWRLRASDDALDRSMFSDALTSARNALAGIESSVDRDTEATGIDQRESVAAALAAIETIGDEQVGSSDGTLKTAIATWQASRQNLHAGIEKLDQQINQWQAEVAGERKWVRSLLLYGQLVILGLVGVIYLSRRAEKHLRSSAERDQRRFAKMLSELPEPIYVEDEAGRVLFWNRGAEKLYGWPSDSMVGKVADPILGLAADRAQHRSQHSGTESAAVRWKGEIKVQNASGKTLNVERHRTKIVDGGKTVGVVVLDVDLGERKRMQVVDRRRQRLESLGTLASGIAHDLNNLLTPILMSSKMLARHDPKINREALIETIQQGATRGAGLIEQLLLFARGGEGQQTPLDLVLVLRDTAKILERTLKSNITFNLSIPDTLPLIMGDETELSQVVMNLAINARDAMPTGGVLTVSAAVVELEKDRFYAFTQLPVGRYIQLEVRDTGVGISPQQRDRIFEPFFSTKERGQGTGLGLSTSLGIIKSHRGAVEVKSVVGEGTTIAVMLPIQDPN